MWNLTKIDKTYSLGYEIRRKKHLWPKREKNVGIKESYADM